MGLEQLTAIIGNYYNTAFGGAAQQINTQATARKKEALASFGARNMSASGSAEKAIIEGIDKNTSDSLAGISGNLAAQQAGTVSNIFTQDRAFDNQMSFYKTQRKDANDDFVRNLLFGTIKGAATTLLAGPLAGLSADAAKNAVVDKAVNIFTPQTLAAKTDNQYGLTLFDNSDLK